MTTGTGRIYNPGTGGYPQVRLQLVGGLTAGRGVVIIDNVRYVASCVRIGSFYEPVGPALTDGHLIVVTIGNPASHWIFVDDHRTGEDYGLMYGPPLPPSGGFDCEGVVVPENEGEVHFYPLGGGSYRTMPDQTLSKP